MENETFLEEFKKYIANPKSRLIILSGVAVFSIVSIALVFIVINNNNSASEVAKAQEIEANPSQKADILSQIVKNNPKTSLNTNQNSNNPPAQDPNAPSNVFNGNSGYVKIDPATGLPVGVNQNPVAVGPGEQPDLTKYNYRKTTETVTKGNFQNLCGYNYSYLSAGRFSTAEFFDPQNSYYTRQNDYVDGTLKGYYNSHYSPTVNESYSYAGGSYGVKEIYNNYWYSGQSPIDIASYPVATSFPVSYNVEVNQIIRSYFGTNAIIQRVYQQANRTFYEIRSDYYYNCNGDIDSSIAQYVDSNNNLAIASIYTVDAKTFEILSTKAYVDRVDPSLLVFDREFQVEYKLTDFSQVNTEFTINYANTVKTVNHTAYVYSPVEYGNRLSNYLKNNSMTILVPHNDVNFAYFAGRDVPPQLPNADYQKDRNYYAPGPNGDQTYQELIKNYNYYPFISYQFQTGNGYYTYSFVKFDANGDYNTALQQMRNSYGGLGTTEFNKTIKIGNNDVDVLLRQTVQSAYYYYATSYPTSFVLDLANKYPTTSVLSYPASYPYPGNYFYVQYQFLFQFNGDLYTGYIPGWAIDKFLTEPFDSINVGTQEGFNAFTNLIPNGVQGEGYY